MSTDAATAAKTTRQRTILGSAWVTLPGTLAVVGGAYAVLPPLPGLLDPGARLGLAARWLSVAVLPYAAVCMTIAARRFLEGSHNPLAGTESEDLKVHCRVMQNTLEQLVWFALCALSLATLLTPTEARVLPVVCVFFAFARFVYWWGYFHDGTLARAPGVQLTLTLNVSMLLAVAVLAVRALLAG